MRTFLTYSVIVLILATTALWAFISHQPNHPWLVRAESWPGIGAFVIYAREAYRPPETVPVGGAREPPARPDVEVLTPGRPPWEGTPGYVWVQPGTVVRADPAGDARELRRIDAITNLARLERRGEWFRVWRYDLEGWVHLPDYQESADPPWGEEPDPALPLAPMGPDAGLLADAVAEMDGDEVLETTFGPYRAYVDFEDETLFGLLSGVAAQVEPLWIERHGLAPLGEPLSAVVLYRRQASYRALERASDELRGLDAEGFAGYGLVVTYAGGKKPEEVASTLVHEICHRIHRRALGPALPPWLEEGMADDLARAGLADGRLDPMGYSGHRTTQPGSQGVEIHFDQGLAALWNLREEILRGHLPLLTELTSLSHDEFLAPGPSGASRRLRYDAMALWVRYLTTGDRARHRLGWQSFLRSIAEGGPVTAEALFEALDVSGDQLEADFRTWVYKESRAFVGD